MCIKLQRCWVCRFLAGKELIWIGIALISMGEEIGSDMAIRSFDHLLQYGEPVIRRSVPLALGKKVSRQKKECEFVTNYFKAETFF